VATHPEPAEGSVPSARIVDWLLAGDPSIRFQTLRDLCDAPDFEVAKAQAQIPVSGWGALLLQTQDPDGGWDGGLYNPKWTSTMFTLLLLHWLGLPPGHPQAVSGCLRLLDGAAYFDGGLSFDRHPKRAENCVTAMTVLVGSELGQRLDGDSRIDDAVAWLLAEELDDGGWNCEPHTSPDKHGSFHTTISTLEGLAAYRHSGGPLPVAAAEARGREFLLMHSLYRSHRTGGVAHPTLAQFRFPPQWHFDILRGLEYFRAENCPQDDRMSMAVEAIASHRRSPGNWGGYRPYPGRMWFRWTPEDISRWATLRCARVLRWWESAGSAAGDFGTPSGVG
jgi:hypothetical protein